MNQEELKQVSSEEAQTAISALGPRYGFIMIDLTNGEFVRFLGGRRNGRLPEEQPDPPHKPENGEPAGSWNYEKSPGCGWYYHRGHWYWVCT